MKIQNAEFYRMKCRIHVISQFFADLNNLQITESHGFLICDQVLWKTAARIFE